MEGYQGMHQSGGFSEVFFFFFGGGRWIFPTLFYYSGSQQDIDGTLKSRDRKMCNKGTIPKVLVRCWAIPQRIGQYAGAVTVGC